ncbi:LysR family transcriptional regulator [Acidihalobacter ferrooxydans]|uniref:LysR family transcriptional regulator n=1 Tax=Acidihalobacter ferrooxydans TaxID=1765967 RepID=A0A1P8UD23_9GAMM|nr:LysR family transcriptional regulator [Acidihalobacter ferrooxydans]APZ41755.1 LysR family transcriptional regulator [Acidihalobacter ferrooxydans]
MRLTLDALAVIDAIDSHGSFAAAAEALHRVPSAITYTVQKIEQDLDVQLFDRSKHRAQLTPAGVKLLTEGRHLLHAATDLEALVKRVASGWETELRIAVGDLVPIARLYPVIEAFYAAGHATRIRISREVFGGTWDALVGGRAELVVGASGDDHPYGGYTTATLGRVPFVFVVAPHHPLARVPEPLAEAEIIKHRAVAAADSSRHLPPRTSSLAGTQDVLTVPDMESKCEAHRRGLGVGYIPRHYVTADLKTGRLLARQVSNELHAPLISLAWREGAEGRALAWFTERLRRRDWLEGIVD